MEKKEYVDGFAFSFDEQSVVLIRKNRPQWQAGLKNGVGGKIEPGETPLEAMQREFREETGLDVSKWEKFLVHESERHVIHCFRATVDVWRASTTTDEVVEVTNVGDYADCIPNLRWMIPMALDPEVAMGNVFIK